MMKTKPRYAVCVHNENYRFQENDVPISVPEAHKQPNIFLNAITGLAIAELRISSLDGFFIHFQIFLNFKEEAGFKGIGFESLQRDGAPFVRY